MFAPILPMPPLLLTPPAAPVFHATATAAQIASSPAAGIGGVFSDLWNGQFDSPGVKLLFGFLGVLLIAIGVWSMVGGSQTVIQVAKSAAVGAATA